MNIRVLTIRQRLYLLAGSSLIATGLVLGIMGWSYQLIGQGEHSVRLLEKTAELVHVSLRGANEILLTEGSSASLKLTKDSLDTLKQTLNQARNAAKGSRLAELFEAQAAPASSDFVATLGLFLKSKQFSAGDDGNLIMLGKASTQGDKLVQALTPLIESTKADNQAHKRSVLLRAAMLSGLILLLPTLLTIFIWRSISSAIGTLRHSMLHARTDWDLSVRAKVEGKDELSECSRDFNALIDAFQHIVKETNDATGQLFSSARELASTSKEVADASARQNHAAATTREAVQAITGHLGHVLELVTAADTVSREESAAASRGKGDAQSAVAEMSRIAASVHDLSAQISALSQRSGEISSIVQVIKDIADQTNLLALNAAIEAARAGEQGRGFAVVADEVRKLAERTGQSTTQIGQLIGGIRSETVSAAGAMEISREQVENGAKLITLVGDSLNDIDQGSAVVSRHIVEIAEASNKEKQSVNEIARHVDDIAQMASNNNQASQAVLQSAQTLEKLTEQVQGLVSRFKT
ncbi:MAG: hypothetical protein A2Z44_05245 [Betaproteobacteria bacterium RBG_19FT_COMBO_58_11]|nr:MAG: hypothetical protein A2Z44_05245 [Betaproteobacteria bacterium RBG_19FT_COMBO_58_11]